LTFFEEIITMKIMAGRPTKEPGQKMDIPLRIMLTAEQNQLIRDAARQAGTDVSTWARPILLATAHAITSKPRKGGRTK